MSPATLQATVSRHLPPGYQAVTGAQLAKENANQVNKSLSVVTDFLLVFALVSLFVGSFIILNTFSILVAQRTREFALFRALGASRRQVLLATLIEAAAVGLVAAILGRRHRRPAGDRAGGGVQGGGRQHPVVRAGVQAPHGRGRADRRRRA